MPSGSAHKMRQEGTKRLEILGQDLIFEIDTVNPLIGDALVIYFPTTQFAGTTVSVRVWYSTNPTA